MPLIFMKGDMVMHLHGSLKRLNYDLKVYKGHIQSGAELGWDRFFAGGKTVNKSISSDKV